MKSYPSSAISYSLSFFPSLFHIVFALLLHVSLDILSFAFIFSSFLLLLAWLASSASSLWYYWSTVRRLREKQLGSWIFSLSFCSFQKMRDREKKMEVKQKKIIIIVKAFFSSLLKKFLFYSSPCLLARQKFMIISHQDESRTEKGTRTKKSFHCLDKKIMHFVRHNICHD